MRIITRFAAATLVAAGFGTAAAADTSYPRVVGSGENASVEYATPSLNIVGGALSRMTGSGESASTEVLSAEIAQPRGGMPRVVGTGNDASLFYGDQAPARMAGTSRNTRG
ncbi:hypothetical protein [Falsiroseomonas oryziterrae]|uniref:hypothetical protein n=1 Tax=Falsiroseomonas oryziterrae TaxID=2911368 RepID=UPI001F3A7FDE|nr:hypothetical protein [Roseomonas sp. NPKOSM-4]